jgi:tRNA A-37 threonylcarbamoyl transferase component Bud32
VLRPLDAHAPYDIGSYRLLGGLGSGGMGTVHLAVPPDGGLDDLVALKTVRRDLELQPDFRLRFRREAQAAGAVRSPYVSVLVDADPDAERPWLATQYVAGPPLDEAVSRAGALPVTVVAELGADLARGLAAVHGARLVHRDLKPANVVLGAGGPRLIDFGIAQAYDATALTATGIMVGSPGFMSPEHVAGDRSVTAASDVFCLGAVLCFAATGQGPFHDSELAAIVHRIAQGRPDLSRVPGELRELIASCLDPDPAQRPTTTQLIRDLDPAAANARPGVAPAPRTGAFPWPAGVSRVIGAYETTVGRALLAPPAPQRAPGPAAAPPQPGPGLDRGAVPGSWAASPPRSRGRTRLRWTAGIVSGLVVGVATAVLMSMLDVGGSGGGDDRTGRGGSDTPAAASPGTVVSSGTSDFGPDALDRTKLPDSWSPWNASFKSDGTPLGCALSGTTLVCRLHKEPAQVSLEARNAVDGTFLWRYPAEDATTAETDVGEPDLDGTHVYAASEQQGGIAVLRLSDGRPVATLGAVNGYAPVKARVHKGRLFVAYLARAGAGSAGNVRVRAFATTGDRKQLWERGIGTAYPASLDITGDAVHINGPTESLNLDAATGETLAQAPEACEAMARGGAYLSCASGVRDSATLKKVDGAYRTARPLALSLDGAVLATDGAAPGSQEAELVARDIITGRVRWSQPWWATGSVRVAGDKAVAFAHDGVRTFDLDDGSPSMERTYGGWPYGDDGHLPPTVTLIHGGALFMAFEDGTLLTAFAS